MSWLKKYRRNLRLGKFALPQICARNFNQTINPARAVAHAIVDREEADPSDAFALRTTVFFLTVRTLVTRFHPRTPMGLAPVRLALEVDRRR